MNHIHFPIDIGRAESLLEQNAVLDFGEVRKHPSAGGAQTRHLHTGDSLIEDNRTGDVTGHTSMGCFGGGYISRSLGCREQSGLKDCLEELLRVSRAWDVFRPDKGQLEGIPGSKP